LNSLLSCYWPQGSGLLGRAAAVYPLCALFAGSSRCVPLPYQRVLFWGGLKGALALTLALGLPPGFPHGEEMLYLTFANVAVSIVLQGLTVLPLLRNLGLTAQQPVSARPLDELNRYSV
jgi:CPA1 family monovalent cation:H+ antiporter